MTILERQGKEAQRRKERTRERDTSKDCESKTHADAGEHRQLPGLGSKRFLGLHRGTSTPPVLGSACREVETDRPNDRFEKLSVCCTVAALHCIF